MGKSNSKEPIQVIVAKVTVFGTIITAVIGLVGTIAASLISNRAKPENEAEMYLTSTAATETLATSVYPPSTITFLEENFLNNEAQWTLHGFNNDGVDLLIKNGYLRLEVKDATVGEREIVPEKFPVVENFEYEVDVKSVTGNAFLGLVFRYTDGGYYLFNVSVDTSKFVFLVWNNGGWNPIIDWSSTPYLNADVKAVNTLKVIARGSQFTLFINGSLIGVANDDTYKFGRVGVGLGLPDTQSGIYEFSNLKYKVIAP